MTDYKEPYPTIKDLIKNKDYDYVEYRNWIYGENIFAGCFSSVKGKIVSIDGDAYDPEEKVIASEEWSSEDIEKGLTIIVKKNVIKEGC